MSRKLKKLCYLSVATKETNKKVKIEEKSNDWKIEKIGLTMVTKDSNIKKVEIEEKFNECRIEKIINLYLRRSFLNPCTIIG